MKILIVRVIEFNSKETTKKIFIMFYAQESFGLNSYCSTTNA